MRADIDQLMEERELDALLVMGDSDGNKVMNYLTGGVHLEGAMIVKERGKPAVLIHGSMERDTAAGTGLDLVNRDTKYNRYQLLEENDGNRLAAEQDYMQRIIQDFELHGRIGVYGKLDAGEALALLHGVNAVADGAELVGEYGDSLFDIARETKDNQELAELKAVGQLTCQVVGEVQAFIQQHRIEDDVVVREDGSALTVGHVKQFMRQRLFAVGLNDHNATIFSQGANAAVPHNRGDAEMPLRLGHTIIFDIFPQSEDSGYYSDMTRTWCLGYAPDDVQEAWNHTKAIFDMVMQSFKAGTPCRDLQMMTCKYYESQGYNSVLSHPGTEEGYVHSLGHGIGLDVHEEPRLSHAKNYNNTLQPGHVITVEPGLYFPSKNFGIRIEDAVALDEDGELIWLTEYPHDLVIPMENE